MTEHRLFPYFLILAAGLWAVVVLYVSAALTRLVKLARRDCWPRIHKLIPAADLAGTWLGTIGCAALAFGRPFRWLIKGALPFGVGLFLVAATVAALRNLHFLRRGEGAPAPDDGSE